MPHYYIHNISHATPLLEAIQRYFLGILRALLGRGSNASDAFGSFRALFGFGRNCNGDAGKAVAGPYTGDTGTGDACTGDAGTSDPPTCNAGASDPPTCDAGAGDPPSDRADAGDACTGGGRALTSSSESDNSSPAATLAATLATSSAFAFAFAPACSTKGANSLSNSESEDFVDSSALESLELESLFQSRNLSALPFRAGCATQRLLLWPNCRQFVHFVCFLFRAPFRIRFTLGRPLFFPINGGNILR
jgi:hypothetical protein